MTSRQLSCQPVREFEVTLRGTAVHVGAHMIDPKQLDCALTVRVENLGLHRVDAELTIIWFSYKSRSRSGYHGGIANLIQRID